MFEKLIKKCSQEINSIQKKVINYDNEKLDNQLEAKEDLLERLSDKV